MSGSATRPATAERRNSGRAVRDAATASDAATAVATAVCPLGWLGLAAVANRRESGGRGRSTTAFMLQNRTCVPT